MNKAAPGLILLGNETLPDSRKLNSSKINLISYISHLNLDNFVLFIIRQF